MAEEFDAAYWDARYRGHEGHDVLAVSPHLVTEVAHLAPGTALDAGCGEGRNAIWLAEHGWRVTAVDVSSTALSGSRGNAEGNAVDLANRIDWVEADLTDWGSPTAPFDLVTAHYVHPAGPAHDLVRRLAAGVAPGGTLLVVDHDRSDEHALASSSAAELLAGLDPEGWDVEVAERRERRDTDPHGREVTWRDVVLRSRRRA